MICKQKNAVQVIPPFQDVEQLIKAARCNHAIRHFEEVRNNYNRDLKRLRDRYRPDLEASLEEIRSCMS